MGFSEVIVTTERKGKSDGKYKMGFSKVMVSTKWDSVK